MQGPEAMEREEDQQPQLRYDMRGMTHTPEDILFCVDADVELNVEMKVGGGKVGGGGGMSRLDAIKQAILLFVHSKLTVHPQHKFSFATVRNTASWVTTALFLSVRLNSILSLVVPQPWGSMVAMRTLTSHLHLLV